MGGREQLWIATSRYLLTVNVEPLAEASNLFAGLARRGGIRALPGDPPHSTLMHGTSLAVVGEISSLTGSLKPQSAVYMTALKIHFLIPLQYLNRRVVCKSSQQVTTAIEYVRLAR